MGRRYWLANYPPKFTDELIAELINVYNVPADDLVLFFGCKSDKIMNADTIQFIMDNGLLPKQFTEKDSNKFPARLLNHCKYDDLFQVASAVLSIDEPEFIRRLCNNIHPNGNDAIDFGCKQLCTAIEKYDLPMIITHINVSRIIFAAANAKYYSLFSVINNWITDVAHTSPHGACALAANFLIHNGHLDAFTELNNVFDIAQVHYNYCPSNYATLKFIVDNGMSLKRADILHHYPGCSEEEQSHIDKIIRNTIAIHDYPTIGDICAKIARDPTYIELFIKYGATAKSSHDVVKRILLKIIANYPRYINVKCIKHLHEYCPAWTPAAIVDFIADGSTDDYPDNYKYKYHLEVFAYARQYSRIIDDDSVADNVHIARAISELIQQLPDENALNTIDFLAAKHNWREVAKYIMHDNHRALIRARKIVSL